MRNKTFGSIALGIIVVISIACFFSSSQTTIKGVVMNYGNPVEGATVTFGPSLGKVKAITGKDGRFELTASHRPMGMLYLEVEKKGMLQEEKHEFPGFAAPSDEIVVQMLQTVSY